jgi:hypothetical protein
LDEELRLVGHEKLAGGGKGTLYCRQRLNPFISPVPKLAGAGWSPGASYEFGNDNLGTISKNCK